MGDNKRRKLAIGESEMLPYTLKCLPLHCTGDFSVAKDCIRLHLITAREDFEDESKSFSPDFVEEYFGETGRIDGYKGLKIDIWIHDSSFYAYSEVKYDSKNGTDTDISSVLKDIFGSGLIGSREEFLNNLNTYNTTFSDILEKHGQVISSWTATLEDGTVNEVVRMELKGSEVKEWHKRLTPLILFLVEGASAIEIDDPLWEVYVAIQRGKGKIERVAGLCNVYRFFHYPESSRLRISQLLVLPPSQNKRYGYHLLESINKVAMERDLYDVTMEDPSERLQELRDVMDVLRLFSSSTFNSTLKSECNILPPSQLVKSVRKELKMCKMQLHRCWEAGKYVHACEGVGDGDGGDGDGERVMGMIIDKLRRELLDKEGERRARLKQVIDTENDYDSSKTFMMMAFKRGDGEGEGEGAGAGSSNSEEEEGVQELLKQRKEEVMKVADKVIKIKKSNV